MAITTDATCSGYRAGAAVSGTLNHVASAMVVAFTAGYRNPMPVCTSVTVGGDAATRLSGAAYPGAAYPQEGSLWYLYRPVAANEYVTATYGTGTTEAVLGAASFVGTLSSDAFECVTTGTSAGVTESLTVAAGQGARRVIGGVGVYTSDIAPSGNQTTLTSYPYASGATEAVRLDYYDTDASRDMSYTVSTNRYSVGVAFGLRAADTNLADEAIQPSAPYMPLFAQPRIVAWTATVGLPNIMEAEIRLGANGSLGGYQLLIPCSTDAELGVLRDKINEDDRIMIRLRQGPVERTYTGIIETVSAVRGATRAPPHLKIIGRGYVIFLSRRNYTTDFTNRTIYSIVTSTTDGIPCASGVSEIEIGPYVQAPSTTISTTWKYRSALDLMNECMLRAGGVTTPWTYWVCHGQHAGETKENLHFRQKVNSPSPIVLTEDDVYSSEVLSTTQFLRNQVETEYLNPTGATILSEIRNDTTSQTNHGKIYTYNYASFLTTAAGAQDWGDKYLYRSAGNLRAISLTVPFNLFLEPNYTIRYVDRTTDRQYDIGSVTHRLGEREAITIIDAATTLS